MTIDAGWVKILKKGAPHAFTARPPFAPAVVFIDGQIKLMKSDAIRTWEGFLKCQFLATIDHAFATGASTVVLGFDDYEFVPTAKSMTQRKRMSSVAAIEFNLEQELPACIPDCWPAAIKNRAFKSQVVGFVLRNLRARFRDEAARTLILDYRGAPEVLGKAVVLPRVFYDEAGAVRTDLRRGECDVKAWAWAELGPLQIQSTDGDFVPIGLLQLAQHAEHRICLHRMRTRVGPPVPRENTKREYEYVDMRALLAHVGGELCRSQDPVRDLAAMIAAVGCDFTMSLPLVGPTKLWQLRAEARGALGDRDGLWRFLVHAHLHMYQKHVKNFKALHAALQRAVAEDDYADVYQQIYTQVRANAATPQRTRNALWAPSRFAAHVRNALWTLAYWERLERAADPLDGDHGYVKVKNHVTYVL
jgi:hypothetical protein